MADDRIGALERRRRDLLERRRELRAVGAAAAEIVPVVEELDRIEAELRAVTPPAREEDDELRWKDALLVTAASILVGAVATGAAALAFRNSSSGATAADTVVHARLHSTLRGASCSATTARARLMWTWTVESSGHDGEVATIRATGPGLAPTYRVPVHDGRVLLARTTACEPVGTVWKVRLVRVGSTPALLSQ